MQKVECVASYVVECEATELQTGEQFTKLYEVQTGMTGTLHDEGTRFMVRLDRPIMATNESEAPYESQLHRVFLYTSEDVAKWSLTN